MKMNDWFEAVSFATIILAPVVILLLILAIVEQKADAIKRGYALYCPLTGDFAWVGECEE